MQEVNIQQQATGQSAKLIGVVSSEFTNPYSVKMLNEVTRQLDGRGYMTLLLNASSADSFHSLMQKAALLKISGLVYLTSPTSDELTVVGDFLPSIPAVHLFGDNAGEDAAVVRADGYEAGMQTGRLMLSQGYQRFGFMQGRETAILRQMDGFADSLKAADRKLDKVLIAGNDDRELAWQAMMTYLKQTRASDRINALFCENDLLAFGAMQAVRDFGQGVHLGVVGFNDIDDAGSSTWHLTSWAPRTDLQVTEALNRLLEDRSDLSGLWQKGELKIRHSHLGKEVLGEIAKCGCASRH